MATNIFIKSAEPVAPPPVQITVSHEDAVFLYSLVGQVGGRGRVRAQADRFYSAFEDFFGGRSSRDVAGQLFTGGLLPYNG